MKRYIVLAIVTFAIAPAARAQFVPRHLTIIGGGCSNNPWVGASSNIYGDILRGQGLYQIGQAARMEAAAKLLRARADVYYREMERRRQWAEYTANIRRQKREREAAKLQAKRDARRREKEAQAQLVQEEADFERQLREDEQLRGVRNEPLGPGAMLVSFRPDEVQTSKPSTRRSMFQSR